MNIIPTSPERGNCANNLIAVAIARCRKLSNHILRLFTDGHLSRPLMDYATIKTNGLDTTMVKRPVGFKSISSVLVTLHLEVDLIIHS